METLKNVDHANVNNNDISTAGRDHNRNANAINFNSTTVNGAGNSESSFPKFLDQIPPIDCESKHNHIKSSVTTHPDAGDWLLKRKVYTDWKYENSSKRLLWLHGIPGVGKTVICSRVIDDLRNKQNDPVVFFYCYEATSSRTILASLLRQLLTYTPPDSSKFKRILKNYNETNPEGVYDLMLRELLREISLLYEKVFIVIDALNECSNLGNMLQELVNLAKELYIFISSRDHAAIRTKFEHYEQLGICEDDIIEDIRRCVAEEVNSITIQSNTLRESVTNKLVMGAQGSFLWPVCQAQRLRGAKTGAEIEDILTTIPQGIQNVIVKSLKTIGSGKKGSEFLCSALRLVVCMPRPITVQALSEVMGTIEMKDTWNPDLITRDPRGVVDDFGGILICVSGKERNRYESCWPKDFSFHNFGGDDIVVPFHLCVKDYLLANPVMLPPDLKQYSLYSLKANDDSIATVCLRYRDLLHKRAWSLNSNPAHDPFAKYAHEWLSRTRGLREGTKVFKKAVVIVIIILVLLGYIFVLTRPCRLPSFLLLGHEQLGSEWEKVVSCKVVSESPKRLGWFGEPESDIRCTASSVMDSQMEKRFFTALKVEVHKLRNEGNDTVTKAVEEAVTSRNPVPPLNLEKEETDNEATSTPEMENEFTKIFEYWVTHSGTDITDQIASEIGSQEEEEIRIETAMQLLASLEPPPPPSHTVKGYNQWLDKPRPTTFEEYLRNFEVIFVVDDSGSMKGGRWKETRDALATIAQKTFELNIDTVSLRFLNDASYVRGLKGENKLMSLFDTVRPRGWTPLGRALRAVFKEHLNRIDNAIGKGEEEYSKIPSLDIIVLTDGVPTDKGEDELREVIAKAVKRLNDNHYHPNTMSVQIIQIANEEKAKKVFKDLVIGDNGRIVGTVPYTGVVDSKKLLRILLGGVHPNVRSQLPVAMLALEQQHE